MAIKFSGVTRHQGVEFIPGVSYAFEDSDAEPYFTNAGWASTTDEPAVRTYSQDEVSIDPLTRSAEDGKFVLPDHPEAVAAAAEQDAEPGVAVHDIQQGG